MDYLRTSFIHFQAGGMNLALPMSQVVHIMGEANVRRNDMAIRPYGWIDDPAGEMPVIDLGSCLGKAAHVHGSPCQFITIRDHGRNLVLLIQKVFRVRQPGMTHFKSLLTPVHHLSRSLFIAAAREEPTLFLLDFEGLAHLAGLETKPFPSLPSRQSHSQVWACDSTPSMLSFSSNAVDSEPRWGLSTTQVAEILKVASFDDLPVVPDYFLGLLWWREEPVPIIDLNLRQGKMEKSPVERVLIARLLGASSHIGLSCNSDMRIERDLGDYQTLDLDPLVHPSFAIAAFEKGQQVVVIPNIDAILA